MSDQSLQQLLITNFGLLPSGYTGSQGSLGYTGSVGGTNLSTSESYLTSGSTSGTGWQKVPINTSKVDEAGWWDNANRYFKPTLAGWYLVSGRARTNSATLSALAIGKNGAHVQGFGNDTNANQIAIGGSQVIYLNGTTDYVDLRAYANANGTAYTTGTYDTYLQISGPLQAGPLGYTGSTGSVQYAPGTAVPNILTKTNSSQQSVGSGSTVLVNLNTVVTGSAALSNGTDGFIAPRSGVYMVDVGYITNNSTHVDITEIQAIVYVNGVAQKTFYENIPNFGFNKSINGTAPVYLNTGDVVKIYFWVYNDTLIIAANSCYVTVTEMMPPSTGYAGSTGSTGTIGYTGSAAVAVAGSNAFYNTRTYTGNGTQTAFAVTVGATNNTVIVTENGVVQTPVVDYTVTGTTLTFSAAPEAAVAIQIRELSTGGITGGNSDRVFVVNDLTVTANYAIPSGKGASTVGPVTINDNVIVSVPTGSRWVIL